MKKILLEYEESNNKWYMYIDDNCVGKFYDRDSAIKQLIFRDIGLKQ